MAMLACVNPGAEQLGETTNVIEYARTATSITTRAVHAEVHELNEYAAAALDDSADPMHGDEFDADKRLNRHAESIDTNQHGALYA
eukprot:7379467-Prymnesium_polylepis.1